MRLPEVREAMHSMADRLEAKGEAAEAVSLRKLAEETRRRSPIARAARTAKQVTPAKVAEVWDCWTRHPDWTFRRIGYETGVDQ